MALTEHIRHRKGLVVQVEELKPGDVVVVVWHDAAEFRDCQHFYTPGDVGMPGLRYLEMGMVVTNQDGWLRLASSLTYPQEDVGGGVVVKNQYREMPWSWLDRILWFGGAEDTLLDVWDKAQVGK